MEEPEGGGKRLPAKDGRKADRSQPSRKTAAKPASKPKPVAASRSKVAPGVPMAGRSYAKRRAEDGTGRKSTPESGPPPAPRPRPRPKASAPADLDLDLDEDFELEDDYEEEVEEEVGAEPDTTTPSSIYSTRRALAEQVNKDVAERPEQDSGTSLDGLKDRREAWKQLVKEKEETGQSPYVTRWAKVSFFPLIYLVVSLSLLRKIRYEYSEYYDYDPIYILLGFGLGAVFLVFATTGTLLRARRARRPIVLRGKSVWFALVVFIGASFYLAFSEGLAYAWLFSIGFLAAGLLVAGIGFALEKAGKGVYWVKDPAEGSDKRWLEFVPVGQG